MTKLILRFFSVFLWLVLLVACEEDEDTDSDENGSDIPVLTPIPSTTPISTPTPISSPTPISNIAPVASDLQLTTPSLQAKELVLLAVDEDGDPLDYIVILEPQHGQLVGAAPNIRYVPNDGFSGIDSFTFKVNDGLVDSNIATVTIDVRLVNNASKIKVFLMGGQSNMVGYGSNSDLTLIDEGLLAVRDDVFIQSVIEPRREYGPLLPGFGAGNTEFGVELKFGQVLGDILSEDIYLFKAAKGGTSLDNAEHWVPQDFGGNEGNLYQQMMGQFQTFIQTNLVDKNLDYEIAAFIWFHGYNDTLGTEERYEENLRNLLISVRSDLDNEDLPVIITQINDVRGAAGDIVMEAQATVAAENNRNTLVLTDDQRPYYHYGSSSYVVIGERIAQATLPFMFKPASTLDEYNVEPGMTLTVNQANGLLVNDIGLDLRAELRRTTSHGSLVLSDDGSFRYTPNDNFQGQDSFEYRAVSGSDYGNQIAVTLWVRAEDNALVLHYDFDTGGEDDLLDKVSDISATVLNNGVSFGHEGRVGMAAYFNGSGFLRYLNDYPIPEILDLSSDRNFSLALWVKPDQSDIGEQILISNKHSYNVGNGFTLTTDSSGTGVNVFLGAYNSEKDQIINRLFTASGLGLNDGSWHHIAASFDFSENLMTLYVDGQAVGQMNLSGIIGDINRYESCIGDGSNGGDGNSAAFMGYMDDVQMYRDALSEQDVQRLFNQ